MGTTWVLSAPDVPHIGPMKLAISHPVISSTCPLQWVICLGIMSTATCYSTPVGMRCWAFRMTKDKTLKFRGYENVAMDRNDKNVDKCKDGAMLCPVRSLLNKGGTVIWGSGEIEEKDINKYKQTLDAHKAFEGDLLEEVRHCSLYNHPIRFQLAHDFLVKYHGIVYNDARLHYRQMDNLLLVTLCSDSWEIAKFLIRSQGSGLIMKTCKTKQCEGMTPLHIAIIKQRSDIINLMMEQLTPSERKELINIQGSGTIFKGHYNNCSNPTTLALFCGYMAIFFDLIRFGGDVDAVDNLSGNGPLHTLIDYGVLQPDKALAIMNDILNNHVSIGWFCKKYGISKTRFTNYEHTVMKATLLKARNREGYSSLTYAAKLGVYDLLVYIMEVEGVYKETDWQLGTHSKVRYDISEIDPTVVRLQNPNQPNVMELLLYSQNVDNIGPLATQPLRQLLDMKWKNLKVFFTAMLVMHLVVISMQTSVALMTDSNMQILAENSDNNASDRSSKETVKKEFAKFGMVSVCLMALVYMYCLCYDIAVTANLLINGRLRWRQSGHYKVPWSIVWKTDYFNVISFIYVVFSLAWLPLLADVTYAGCNVLTAIALVSGWYFTLFYTRPFRSVSFFNVMLGRMLLSDLLKFTIVMTILVLGFGSAIITVSLQPLPESIATPLKAAETMFLLLVGMAELDFIEDSMYPEITSLLTLTYIVLGTILLLNMLIASMSDTFSQLSDAKETLWLKMRLYSILIFERRMFIYMLRRRLRNIFQYDETNGKWYLEVELSAGTSSTNIFETFGKGIKSKIPGSFLAKRQISAK